ncbi:MAG: hypothetical protein HQ580_07975 [Planctomycetes bacterium]|nr:hypothetical protein [Planctomycetota bacterium]
MLRISLMILVVLILPVVVSASTDSDSPFNVDFFFGWSNYYRPMEWTPVEIGIASTLTEPFAGSVTVSAQQDGLNALDVVHTFVLTPDVPLHLPLVTKLAFTADKCGVRLSDERGRTRWDYDFNLWNLSTRNRLLTVVHENDLLIGLVGRGKFGLLRLPKQSFCQSQSGRGKVYLGDKLPRMVPWDWTGFVSLDLLILYDPDWNLFNQHQLNAIAQWVSNGGKLLLVPGSQPLSVKNPIAQLLPFELQDVKRITVAVKTLEQLGLISDEPDTVMCWPLVPKPGARFYEIETYNTGESLFGTGYTGFGRVGVLAFDPSTLANKQRANSSTFWVERITAILEDSHIVPVRSERPIPPPGNTRSAVRSRSGRTATPMSRNKYDAMPLSRSIRFVEDAENNDDNSRFQQQQRRYEIGRAQAANNAVMEYLYDIYEMRPLSIWWVILLLITLAVLLGPVDYKILKRRGRLPLTWLTCAFWIILFTVGAYYGVQALRGGKMQLRVVSVLDGIDGSNQTWSTDYCGLFASGSGDYEFKGLKDNQWWSGIAPSQQSIWAYNREISGRKIYCFQHDGGNLPYSLPINIWTIQCLLNESPLEQLPFDAQVERNGNEVVVNIVNDSNAPILNGYALLGNDRGINFGSVPANATKQFRSQLHTMRFWNNNIERYQKYSSPQRSRSGNFENEEAFFAQGSLQRTQTIGAYLARGAAMVCVQYDKAPVSFAVKDRSCSYDHIQLARLVVFPQEQ